MKKLLIVLISVFMLLAMTACSDHQEDSDSGGGKNPFTSQTSTSQPETTAPNSTQPKLGYASILFDANGGVFPSGIPVMTMSFEVAKLHKDDYGMVNLRISDPYFLSMLGDAANGDMVLGGWYRERTETTDSEGNKTYSYSGKFNFENDRIVLDSNKEYSSAEPVLTLYALWIPKFEVHYYSLDTGELLQTYKFNPMGNFNLSLPAWNQETGKLDMYRFPKISGMTFEAAYYDQKGTQPVTDTIVHPGQVMLNGEVQNPILNIYVTYREGNWYHIFNAEQLSHIADPDAHYVLHADLDFSYAFWPASFSHRKFTGSIEGNGYTIKNVTIEQRSLHETCIGLFGTLAANSQIRNVTFENISLYIDRGARSGGACFGLLAGVVEDGAHLQNISISNSTIIVDDNCFWRTDDYSIGLLCGSGSFEPWSPLASIDYSGITCQSTGEGYIVEIIIEGNFVTLVFDES